MNPGGAPGGGNAGKDLCKPFEGKAGAYVDVCTCEHVCSFDGKDCRPGDISWNCKGFDKTTKDEIFRGGDPIGSISVSVWW